MHRRRNESRWWVKFRILRKTATENCKKLPCLPRAVTKFSPGYFSVVLVWSSVLKLQECEKIVVQIESRVSHENFHWVVPMYGFLSSERRETSVKFHCGASRVFLWKLADVCCSLKFTALFRQWFWLSQLRLPWFSASASSSSILHPGKWIKYAKSMVK